MVDPIPSGDKTKTDPVVTGATKPGTPAPASKEPEKTVPLAALHEEREKIRSLREEIESLKAVVHNRPYTPEAAPQPSRTQLNQQQMDQMWESDPRRAMQAEIGMAINWFDQASAEVDNQADAVATKYTDFNTYRSDVMRHLRVLPLESRNRPGVVEAAYFYVKGQKADNLVNLSREELISRIRAGERVQGLDGAYTSSGPAPVVKGEPTQDQIRMAANMRIPIDEYMRNVR